jgi:hypothetical protein
MVHFTVDGDARLVCYVVEGVTTADHARAFFAAVLTHPDYETGFNFLGDRREIGEEPDSAYVRAVALEVMTRQAVLGPCRWAVLVATDASYGMARMWGLLTESTGVEIKPFRTLGEAAKWLGLPADYSLPALAAAG